MRLTDFNRRKRAAFSYDLHTLLCAKLKAEPRLLEQLKKRNAADLRMDACSGNFGFLRVWSRVLAEGADAAIALALEKGEWGDAMRSCSPFSAIADCEERLTFMRKWNRRYASPEDLKDHPLFSEGGR